MSYVAVKMKKGNNSLSFNTSNQLVLSNGTNTTTFDPTGNGLTGNGTDNLLIDGNGQPEVFTPEGNQAKLATLNIIGQVYGVSNQVNVWDFSDDTGAAVGNAPLLTLTNNAAVSFGTVGQVRYADFNAASSQYFSLANSGSAGQGVRFTGSFTLSLWVNPDRVTGTQYLIAKENNDYGTPANSTQAYALYLNTTTLRFRIRDDSETNGGTFTYIGRDVTTAVTTGTWKHIVAVYNSDGADVAAKVLLYINGANQAGSDQSGGSFTQVEDITTAFTIGANTDVSTLSNIYDGKMALIHAYPAALTANQAKAIYDRERRLMGL